MSPVLRLRAAIARVVLLALAPLALDGCVSVGLSRSPLEKPGTASAELRVSIHRTTGDRDAGVAVTHPVLSELIRVEEGRRTVVARSMAPSWAVAELPPGDYVLRAARKIDADGNVVPLKGRFEQEVALKAGERVQAKVVLEKVPVLWIVLAVVTVIVLVVLLIDLGKEGKLPLPPPPPLPRGFVGVVVELPFRAGAPSAPNPEPGVADVFPAPGSVVAARRVAVSFFVTTPIDERSIGKDAFLAVGSLSGEIPGSVEWMPEERLLRFVPSQDFRSGDTVTVTLDLENVESAGGRSGNGLVSTSFRVP